MVRIEKVRVCLAGAGRAGLVHADNIARNISEADLTCLVEPNPEVAREASSRTGVPNYPSIEDAIGRGDFDAVIIATPTYTHASIAKSAAIAGKHIFCEKPMALNLKESDEMIATCKENRVILQIGFMRRFDKVFIQAKKYIQEGTIGRIAIIRSTGRGPGLPPRWAYDPKRSLGMLGEVNSHDFDCIRWLGGSDFSRIYAEADTFKCLELKKDFPAFYDNSVVSMRLKNGILASLDGSCPVEYGYDARVEILGTEGVMMVGEQKEKALSLCTKERGIVTPAFSSWRHRFREAYVEEIRHFVNCVLKNKEPMVTGEDGRKAVEAVLAATKSIFSQKPVNLPMEDESLEYPTA